MASRFNPFARPLQWLSDIAVRILTKPLKSYELHSPNDMANLKRHIRKGDVVLVEGNERISECIKYLTQSSWSHAALFVGDEPLRRNPQQRDTLRAEFGEEMPFLIVEALVESGVILAPLAKYRDFNIRVCRPYNLSAPDLAEVMEEALRSVGGQYDIKNALDLGRYFLPVSMIPRRFRRRALEFGSGEPTRVICSSLLASCFNRVRFPIIPRFEQLPDNPIPVSRRLMRWPRRSSPPSGIWRQVPPTFVTPRDFDLSPYFEIIKFNIIESMRFDYRKIQWADDLPPEIKKGA